ncbi:hypothetical protein DPMN_037901 [Dreissena polymorpha]|uniref:B box-type domain-containing protein n=1 Tax=Dreissena polymorpha TaxID=45954 RepID=A0A9D4RQ77_DREPO|nr:hypothetical protein DPMN_037901 [Dreissena polymorpha]
MAESVESSLHKGSDMFLDYICTACEERSLSIEASSYCEKCATFLCEKCISPHTQLYGKHVVLGRDDVEKWPLLKCSIIDRCPEHENMKIACFCENHDQLCCYSCVSLHHRTCANVKLITDSCNVANFYDADNVKENLKEINTRLNTARIDKEDDIKELESSYQQILSKIKAAREKTISDIIVRENDAIGEV